MQDRDRIMSSWGEPRVGVRCLVRPLCRGMSVVRVESCAIGREGRLMALVPARSVPEVVVVDVRFVASLEPLLKVGPRVQWYTG